FPGPLLFSIGFPSALRQPSLSSRSKARNNQPAFRRKTPLLICSIRTEIPYPCIGSSANVFRMSISSVPWTRSLGLSGINLIPLGYQEEHTLLLLVVNRRKT